MFYLFAIEAAELTLAFIRVRAIEVLRKWAAIGPIKACRPL